MGLHTLLLAEEREKRQDKVDALKRAIVASAGLSDPMKLARALFPDMFEEPEPDEVTGEAVSTREDLTNTEGVEWRFTESISPEEAKKIMATMVADPHGRLGLHDLVEADDDGWN